MWPSARTSVACGVNNTARIFAILRRITMNLLRLDPTVKVGLKIRQGC
jgi:hypothetical protein